MILFITVRFKMNTGLHPAFNRNFVNIHIEPATKCANSVRETRVMLFPADNHRVQENHKKDHRKGELIQLAALRHRNDCYQHR